MKTQIKIFDDLKRVVNFFSKHLRFDKFQNKTGRKLAISIDNIIALALFKQARGIVTKKSVYEIFKNNLNCTYKTFVVNINRWAYLAAVIIMLLIKMNRKNQHLVKHIDSTDIPVCQFKNANAHKTMKGLAQFGRNSKGTFFGLKLHMISDFRRKILSIKFTAGNIDDRKVVIELSKEIAGILIGDTGYIKKQLQREFYEEGKRMMIAKPRANMKRIMTKFEERLYQTRMLIELNFRNLKMFYGLITSLPRSVDGYLANYIYSLLAYQIA